MSQAEKSNSTEPPGGNPFPAVAETVVGAGLVQTTNARDLHRFLKVGRDFTTWIKARLDKYGFVENVDYVKGEDLSSPNPVSAKSRPQTLTEYHLTLDTAKEIAMVENNEQGRAARRYFIECERRAKGMTLDAQATGGITKGVVRKAIGDMIPDMLAEALTVILPGMVERQLEADNRAVAVGFKPALAVLEERKVPPRRRRAFSQKVSARLRRFSTAHGQPYRISRETGRYLFHVDVIAAWLAAEGDALIRTHIANMAGQGVLPFSPRPMRP